MDSIGKPNLGKCNYLLLTEAVTELELTWRTTIGWVNLVSAAESLKTLRTTISQFKWGSAKETKLFS